MESGEGAWPGQRRGSARSHLASLAPSLDDCAQSPLPDPDVRLSPERGDPRIGSATRPTPAALAKRPCRRGGRTAQSAAAAGWRRSLRPAQSALAPFTMSETLKIKRSARSCWERAPDKTFGDQYATTHLPPTGQDRPSRMPYLSASSCGQRSTPKGSNILSVSDIVNGASADCASITPGAGFTFESSVYSSHHPAGTLGCRKALLPFSRLMPLTRRSGNWAAPRTPMCAADQTI